MGSEIHHMSINLKGMLNFYKRKKITILEGDNGKPLSDFEARVYLRECLDKGWKVIPMNGDCKGFDHQKGCPGHPVAESEK